MLGPNGRKLTETLVLLTLDAQVRPSPDTIDEARAMLGPDRYVTLYYNCENWVRRLLRIARNMHQGGPWPGDEEVCLRLGEGLRTRPGNYDGT